MPPLKRAKPKAKTPSSPPKPLPPPPKPKGLKFEKGKMTLREANGTFYGQNFYRQWPDLFTIILHGGGDFFDVKGLRMYRGGKSQFIDGVSSVELDMETMTHIFYTLGYKEYYLYFYRRPGTSLRDGLVNIRNDEQIEELKRFARESRTVDVYLVEVTEKELKRLVKMEIKYLQKMPRRNGLDSDEPVEVLPVYIPTVGLEWHMGSIDEAEVEPEVAKGSVVIEELAEVEPEVAEGVTGVGDEDIGVAYENDVRGEVIVESGSDEDVGVQSYGDDDVMQEEIRGLGSLGDDGDWLNGLGDDVEWLDGGLDEIGSSTL